MDRINQPYDVNDTGYTQPVSARAGEPIESLRAQARQRPVSGVGSQQSGKIAGRSTAKTDSADISVSAWLRYLKGEEAVTSEKVAENTSQS